MVAVSCDGVLHDRSLVTRDPVVTLHVDLAASTRAPSQARALVASALNGAAGPVLDEDTIHSAQLVASELVTNAVLHARTELHLGICHDDHSLLIAVTDGAPQIPLRLVDPAIEEAEAEESGRGMLIVASLANDFGWRSRDDVPGKIMWVLLKIDGAAPSAI